MPENHTINRQHTELHQDSPLAVHKHISMKQLPKTEHKLITISESLPLQLNDYVANTKLMTTSQMRNYKQNSVFVLTAVADQSQERHFEITT